MKLAKIMENDIVDCDNGICVSVWFFGCPHKCKGCHNAQLWDENCMEETNEVEVIDKVISLINKNGVERNLSILGGEPLAEYNLMSVVNLIASVKNVYPNIKIYLWTGYTLEQLNRENIFIEQILRNIDTLIDGPFVLEKRDTTLKLRGSSNQRIFKNINRKLVEEK